MVPEGLSEEISLYYEFEDEIPELPVGATVRIQHLKLSTGIIRHVEVFFPRGCYCLAHCAIYVGEHQVWPTNPDGDIAGEGGSIPFEEYFPVDPADDWTWRTWNEDDENPHKLKLRILILPEIAVGSAAVVKELKRMREAVLGFEY